MTEDRFPGAAEAWRSSLQKVKWNGRWCDGVTDATSVGSHFGNSPRRFSEILADRVEIVSPRRRIINSRARQFNFGFAVANTLFAFSGSDQVSDIGIYNSKGAAFSTDGHTFACSIGTRIFGTPSQYAAVLQRLRSDETSRRACVVTLDNEDILAPPRDTPCSIAVQFFLRDGALQCITFMRSQSALMVWPYDVFLFTMIQERLALELGVQLGSYYHLCGSLHVYEDEVGLLDAVLGEDVSVDPDPMAPMELPKLGFDELIRFEKRLRTSPDPLGVLADARDSLGTYWSALLDPVARLVQN